MSSPIASNASQPPIDNAHVQEGCIPFDTLQPAPTTADAVTHALPDDEIRIRIAEWMGYERQTRGEMWWHREKGHYYSLNELPAYTTSLDAIASAEARLTDTQHNAYRLQIIHTLAEDQGVPWSDIYGDGRVWFSAPSRIRSFALLRIINPKLP